jgi:nucleoside-diphosphate-sugar epimerase
MTPDAGRRVLVTGAGGFIGSHLAADQSGRGRRVVALDLDLRRVRHLDDAGRFDLLEGDVADASLQVAALDGVDTVFHLAAAHLSVRAGEDAFRRINIDAVSDLARRAKAAGVRRFVHCSTVGVYGSILDPPANEDTPCRPEIAYERTKLEGETVVLRAAAEDGLQAIVLRPVWVYGPGCPRTEKLFRTIARGRFVMAGAGTALRHCVYIRDMLDAFDLAAAADDARGLVVIVGDAAAVRVRDLLCEIAALVEARPPRSIPLWALHACGLVAETVFGFAGREPPLSRRTLKFFTSNTAFDIARARTVLGYEPRYDLGAGLRETHATIASGTFHDIPLPAPQAG